MAAEITNLNKFRKIHKREQKKRQSEKNRVKFGQTKWKRFIKHTNHNVKIKSFRVNN
jgi:hypothetical protein